MSSSSHLPEYENRGKQKRNQMSETPFHKEFCSVAFRAIEEG